MGKGKKRAAAAEVNGKAVNGSPVGDKAVKFQPATTGKSNGNDYLKPSGRGMRPSPSLATLNRLDREKVVIWRRPLTTAWYFLMELLCVAYEFIVSLTNHKLLVSGVTMLAGALVLGYNLPGPHQEFVQHSEELLLWYAYWVGLGILSSVGFGSGLHTFVLYLAPYIAKVTMAAEDCRTLSFPSLSDITCPEVKGPEQDITIWAIWAFVWKATLMWGFGTAIGELPPYFMARTARLSGEEPDDEEYKEFLADLRGNQNTKDEITFFTKCKQIMEHTVVSAGFPGILLFASIPNPLFDLAGITCGHFLVPFHVFFGATVIGKAVVKAQLQAIFVIFLFSAHHIEALVDQLGLIPRIGAIIQHPIKGFLDHQKKKLHHGYVEESTNIFGMMFKKFDERDDITGSQQLKSSVQKGIRNKLIEQYPHLDDVMNEILPKKENFKLIKCKEHVELIAGHDGSVLFVKHRDLPYIPTLRLLHKYPFILPHQQVDKGAIKFVMNGSQIMCPGLTSPGANLNEQIEKDSVVAVMAEGKQHALGIGVMKMSGSEIRSTNKGVGIDNVHYLNDGLWKVTRVQ
ncbi:hypothetical protein QR680_013436 [Steinernema hermaphroditum]|uniref:PUA domain-containing protein n=1 Tax=Steinernema hermaphroditum TaxID=289476 RepID=A0AA39I7K8_9BILA|nr:hypothetical protein QR680_013436 [Steinernema hermaphroditum]